MCNLSETKKLVSLFLPKILLIFCPEQISWQNSIVLSMFWLFFCHEIYDKMSCCTTFFCFCSCKEPERTHLTCNMLCFFSGDGSDIVFLVIATASPAQLARHAHLGSFLEIFYNADWKVLIWYLAAANFFASNDKEYQ